MVINTITKNENAFAGTFLPLDNGLATPALNISYIGFLKTKFLIWPFLPSYVFGELFSTFSNKKAVGKNLHFAVWKQLHFLAAF